MAGLDLIRKYERPVPRYTSFPTALQFTDEVSEVQHRTLIGQIDGSQAISLYVHIPFCHSLCHYCGCHTKITQRSSVIHDYLASVQKEIELVSAALTVRPAVSRIHFGGGSPNYPDIADFTALLNKLASCFDINAQTQIDMEADPRLLTPEKIAAYGQLGITRMSLGIQDFNPAVQQAINRIQPFEHVAECVQTMRKAGIGDINFDLMSGLPYQTVDSVIQTAEQALSLNPDRFAVFAYAHVPWMKKHQALLEKYGLPQAEERFMMMRAISNTLIQHGYKAIGIDHFARPDNPLYQSLGQHSLRRNFQGYTDDTAETILGFGLSAISSFGNAYVQSMTDARLYRQAIDRNTLPTQRGYMLTDDDQKRRKLIEELMCYFKVDLDSYGIAPSEALTELENDGLVIRRGSQLIVTEAGTPFVRLVAACFDPYLKLSESRHAKAI